MSTDVRSNTNLGSDRALCKLYSLLMMRVRFETYMVTIENPAVCCVKV